MIPNIRNPAFAGVFDLARVLLHQPQLFACWRMPTPEIKTMSRHHVTLPPLIYTPVPKPKTTRRRVGVGRLQANGDVDETEESGDVQAVGGYVTPITGRSQDDPDTTDQRRGKPGLTAGRLSETTLRVLLQMQERTR